MKINFVCKNMKIKGSVFFKDWVIKALTDINIKTEKLTFLLHKLSNNTNTRISLLASMAIEKLNLQVSA